METEIPFRRFWKIYPPFPPSTVLESHVRMIFIISTNLVSEEGIEKKFEASDIPRSKLS